jgi:hypothetical protein
LNTFVCLPKEKYFVFANGTAVQIDIATGGLEDFWIPAFAGMTLRE